MHRILIYEVVSLFTKKYHISDIKTIHYYVCHEIDTSRNDELSHDVTFFKKK